MNLSNRTRARLRQMEQARQMNAARAMLASLKELASGNTDDWENRMKRAREAIAYAEQVGITTRLP